MLLKSQFIIWSIAGVKAKVGSNPFIKCATGFPLILWHPYARHHYFCVMTEKEQKKWHAVLQDCVRDSNNGNNANTKQHINRKWQKRLESQRLCEVNAIRIICTSSEHEQCFSLSTLANLSSSVPLLAVPMRVCVTVWSFYMPSKWAGRSVHMKCWRNGVYLFCKCCCHWIRSTLCASFTVKMSIWNAQIVDNIRNTRETILCLREK